jgi:hypothetical protein
MLNAQAPHKQAAALSCYAGRRRQDGHRIVTDQTRQIGGQEARRTLRRVHGGVLAALAACAVVIGLGVDPAHDVGLGSADPRFTTLALGLGLASVLARRQAAAPRLGAAWRLRLGVAALLLAGATGAVGVVLALAREERDAALLYVLGGVILALRPAPSAPPRAAPPQGTVP